MTTPGTLRIYLGAAPGVGKTMAMIAEGQRRLSRGQDVVVALCETHGRQRTAAALDGLEQVARRAVEHRGAALTELDLDAVIARRPEVALVDELAHTNAPGSRNEKRWQDVHELLAAGISVISTVNIQHLESLNDVVETITGVHQAETVPDAVVRGADQIELVDMAPESLRRRMAHGNIYPPARIDAALANYFRVGNLSALRELALLWLADRVEEGLERYRDQHDITSSWPTRERVVVALSGGPEGEALLRRGARIVSRGGRSELMAVHVARGDGLVGAGLPEMTRLRRLTEELGGTFHSVTGDDPGEAILDFARAHNTTLILVGTSRRRRWMRAFSTGVGEEVIAHSGEIDVHVMTHSHAGSIGRWVPARRTGVSTRRRVIGLAMAVIGPALMTLLLRPAPPGLTLTSLLFLLLTVAVTMVGGLLPALITAVVSSLLVNWFFTPPEGTLTIADPHNVAALVVFVMVAWLVSAVVNSGARRAQEAVAAQRETAGLLELSHTLLGSTQQLDLLLTRSLDMFGATAAAVRHLPSAGSSDDGSAPAVVAATAAFDPTGPVSAHDTAGDEHELVLQGAEVDTRDAPLFSAFAAHAGAILARRALQQSADAAEGLARDGRARTALLSAVSHDLRTPLASIKAAIGGLRSDEVSFDDDDRAELEEAIEDSADRLEELIGNLLDMSRLQAGVLVAHCVPVDLGEVLPAVVADSGQGRVDWTIGDDARWAVADAGLLERVLANIVENAVRHQPESGRVHLFSSRHADRVEVRVVDTGPGVSSDDHDAIFLPFQRRGDAPAGNGVGLGLAVAKGLAEAMAATLDAEDTPGGGLTMVVALPAERPELQNGRQGGQQGAGVQWEGEGR